MLLLGRNFLFTVHREPLAAVENARQRLPADARLLIPMRPDLRSINVAMVAAMALGEAMRQTKAIPGE